MSFGFTIKAATAALATAAVRKKIAKVVEAQPIHEADSDLVQAVADSYIGLVEVLPGHQLQVSVSGSLSSYYDDGKLTGASVSVSVMPAPILS